MTIAPRVKCNLDSQLDSITMSNADREVARTHLRHGAFIADIVFRTLKGLRLVGVYARRRVRWLLRVSH